MKSVDGSTQEVSTFTLSIEVRESLHQVLDNLKRSIWNDENLFHQIVSMCMKVGKYQIGKNVFNEGDFKKIVYVDDVKNIIYEAFPDYYMYLDNGVFPPFTYINELIDLFCADSLLTKAFESQIDDLRLSLEEEVFNYSEVSLIGEMQ